MSLAVTPLTSPGGHPGCWEETRVVVVLAAAVAAAAVVVIVVLVSGVMAVLLLLVCDDDKRDGCLATWICIYRPRGTHANVDV